MKKIIIATFLLIATALSASATTYNVASATDINNLPSLLPDDVVILANGTWTDQSILLEGNGTAGHPVTYVAQTRGSVIFNGTTSVVFGHASYVVLDGVYFNGGIVTQNLLYMGGASSFCRLTNCKFNNVNNPILNNTLPYIWVFVGGKNSRIDHCSFDSAFIRGPIMAIEPHDDMNTDIDSNYWGHRRPEPDSFGGGSEGIRVGSSGNSASYVSRVHVYNNWFEGYSAEQEIISNKMTDNLYEGNVFHNCQGLLNLRQGDSCTVRYNFFLGDVDSAKGGIGIYGKYHNLISNYFAGLHGTNRIPVFNVANGASAVNCGYASNPVVVGLRIDSNLVFRDTPATVHGYFLKSTQTLPPLSVRYDANIMVTDVGYELPKTLTAPYIIKSSNNYFFGYTSTFIEGWTNQNPLLVQDSYGIYRLPVGSPLISILVGSNTKTMYAPDSPWRPIAKTATGVTW